MALTGIEIYKNWEQVFIYNHIAQGGKSNPTGERIKKFNN
jgi:hypothetical protein